MKAKKIIAMALLSTTILGAVASTVNADSTVPGKGKVTVTDGELDPSVDPKDPEKPVDPVKPDPEVVTPGDKGSLTILGVSVLDFGTIETSNNLIVQPAASVPLEGATIAEDGTLQGTGVVKNVGNYVQFGDIRGTQNGYTLKAAFTKEFTDATGNEKLTGAYINYTNGVLTHADAKDTNAGHPELKNTMVLNFDATGAAAETVVTKSNTKGGKGIYSVEYGQSAAFEDNLYMVEPGVAAKGTEANSVFLNVPKETAANMAATDYEAVITWTLEAAPAVTP